MPVAVAYEPDTIVMDLDEQAASAPTEELTMHAMVEGQWHRRMPDLSETSCEKRYHSQFAPLRREELTHPLCPICFTPAEIRRADAKQQAERVL